MARVCFSDLGLWDLGISKSFESLYFFVMHALKEADAFTPKPSTPLNPAVLYCEIPPPLLLKRRPGQTCFNAGGDVEGGTAVRGRICNEKE